MLQLAAGCQHAALAAGSRPVAHHAEGNQALAYADALLQGLCKDTS